MTELETFLITALKQIIELHDDGNGAVCKCAPCKLARQSLEAAQHRVQKENKMAQCPYCDCPECKQTTDPDENGQAEFHCPNCGEYFTDAAEQSVQADLAKAVACPHGWANKDKCVQCEAAQQSVQRTVDQPCEKHNMEFCPECYPAVVIDFNRR